VNQNLAKALSLALLGAALGCETEKIVTVIPDLPPQRVDGVYSVTGDRKVTIRWRENQESDIALYRVYRNDAPSGTFTLIGGTPTTEFVDFDVVNAATYFYAVAAVDLIGQESPELSYENVFDTPRPEGFGVGLTNAFVSDPGSGWDFSTRSIGSSLDPATDVYYGAQAGHYIVYASAGTLIQDAGYVALVDVDFAPPGGWSADGQVEAIPGHSYIVLTLNGHYAKFEVVSRTSTSMVMNWAYQLDPNNPELARKAPQ